MLEFADIIFIPYNYLFDNIDILKEANYSLIIDEAHNIIQMAEDAETGSITADILSRCAIEIRPLIRMEL